jgi:hypothetical protein
MFSSGNAFAAGGIIFLIIYIVVSVALFLLVLRIFYSVIWRAVRRGMKEFHKDYPGGPTS